MNPDRDPPDDLKAVIHNPAFVEQMHAEIDKSCTLAHAAFGYPKELDRSDVAQEVWALLLERPSLLVSLWEAPYRRKYFFTMARRLIAAKLRRNKTYRHARFFQESFEDVVNSVEAPSQVREPAESLERYLSLVTESLSDPVDAAILQTLLAGKSLNQTPVEATIDALYQRLSRLRTRIRDKMAKTETSQVPAGRDFAEIFLEELQKKLAEIVRDESEHPI